MLFAVIITYAGRLPGADDFPAENVGYVGDQVARLMAGLRPRLVVGSAAAGADLLVLDAALRNGLAAKVVLAGTVVEFRESSVAGWGPEWQRMFDTITEHDRVDLLEVPRHEDDGASYAAVTKRIREIAEGEVEDGESTVGLNLSAAREGVDHSAALASAQELREHLVLRLDTSRRREESPTAFVAMPFGRRRDPDDWVERVRGGRDVQAHHPAGADRRRVPPGARRRRGSA